VVSYREKLCANPLYEPVKLNSVFVDGIVGCVCRRGVRSAYVRRAGQSSSEIEFLSVVIPLERTCRAVPRRAWRADGAAASAQAD